MNMTLIFEISIARAQKDINSIMIASRAYKPLIACKCSEVVLSLWRGQKGIPGSTPSVRKVSLIICNLTLRRGGGGVKP